MRLNLNREPEWIEVTTDVRICAAPATSAVMGAARHDPLMQDITEETAPEIAALAFSKAVAKQVISAWTGVEDENGKPAPVTPEYIEALFDHYSVFEAWQVKYMARWLGLDEEKNVSAPSPTGISAGAPSTAKPAKASARIARSGKTGRKR